MDYVIFQAFVYSSLLDNRNLFSISKLFLHVPDSPQEILCTTPHQLLTFVISTLISYSAIVCGFCADQQKICCSCNMISLVVKQKKALYTPEVLGEKCQGYAVDFLTHILAHHPSLFVRF